MVSCLHDGSSSISTPLHHIIIVDSVQDSLHMTKTRVACGLIQFQRICRSQFLKAQPTAKIVAYEFYYYSICETT